MTASEPRRCAKTTSRSPSFAAPTGKPIRAASNRSGDEGGRRASGHPGCGISDSSRSRWRTGADEKVRDRLVQRAPVATTAPKEKSHLPHGGPARAESPEDYVDLMTGIEHLLQEVTKDWFDMTTGVVPLGHPGGRHAGQKKALSAIQFGGRISHRITTTSSSHFVPRSFWHSVPQAVRGAGAQAVGGRCRKIWESHFSARRCTSGYRPDRSSEGAHGRRRKTDPWRRLHRGPQQSEGTG